MASGSAKFAYHSTTSSTVTDIDAISMSYGSSFVEVYNRAAAGSANNLFVVTGKLPSALTVLGSDCYIIPAGTSDTIPTNRMDSSEGTYVRILADTASTPYSVVVR